MKKEKTPTLNYWKRQIQRRRQGHKIDEVPCASFQRLAYANVPWRIMQTSASDFMHLYT